MADLRKGQVLVYDDEIKGTPIRFGATYQSQRFFVAKVGDRVGNQSKNEYQIEFLGEGKNRGGLPKTLNEQSLQMSFYTRDEIARKLAEITSKPTLTPVEQGMKKTLEMIQGMFTANPNSIMGGKRKSRKSRKATRKSRKGTYRRRR